jgi:hypothetical protein
MADNLEDASNELILADEEEVRYLIGEVFSHVPVDEVLDWLHLQCLELISAKACISKFTRKLVMTFVKPKFVLVFVC